MMEPPLTPVEYPGFLFPPDVLVPPLAPEPPPEPPEALEPPPEPEFPPEPPEVLAELLAALAALFLFAAAIAASCAFRRSSASFCFRSSSSFLSRSSS